MKRLIPFVLLLAGCNFRYEPTSANSPVEEMLLAETARAAGALSVRVHGEITDTISPAQIGQTNQAGGAGLPTGWYQAGVAWYYRPRVAVTVSIDPEPGRETARNVAGHEVCHAVSFFHDLAHWKCMDSVAAPTYPRPGTSGVTTFACNAEASSTAGN